MSSLEQSLNDHLDAQAAWEARCTAFDESLEDNVQDEISAALNALEALRDAIEKERCLQDMQDYEGNLLERAVTDAIYHIGG